MQHNLHLRNLSSNTRLPKTIINGGGGNNHHIYQLRYKYQHGSKPPWWEAAPPDNRKNENYPTPLNPMEIICIWVECNLVQAPMFTAPPPGVQPTKRWHGTQTTISMTYCVTYTNTIKYFDDLFYCYIYGYDVYHTGSHGLGGKRNKWGHN